MIKINDFHLASIYAGIGMLINRIMGLEHITDFPLCIFVLISTSIILYGAIKLCRKINFFRS